MEISLLADAKKERERFALQKLHKHGFLKLWGSVPGPSEKSFSVQLKKKTNKQTE